MASKLQSNGQSFKPEDSDDSQQDLYNGSSQNQPRKASFPPLTMETQHNRSVQRFANGIDLQNRINLVVLGDSHAANIFDHLSQAGCHRFNLHSLPLIATPVKRLDHPALTAN